MLSAYSHRVVSCVLFEFLVVLDEASGLIVTVFRLQVHDVVLRDLASHPREIELLLY